MILNINQLRSFYMAAKAGSISHAARDLMVTPPAVSMQIKQLEDTLEIRLIYRSGNATRLTEMGRTVFDRCKEIFEKIKDMEDFLEDVSAGKTGVLRLGCPQTPAKNILPALISKFNKTCPGIRVVLNQGPASDMAKSILDGTNELAIIRQGQQDNRLKLFEIASESLILIAAPDSEILPANEVSAAQLAKIPFILPRKGSATREIIMEYFEKFGLSPNIVMECQNMEVLRGLVYQDNGVTLLVKSEIEEDLRKGLIKQVQLLEGQPILKYGVGYLARNALSPAGWAFLRMVEKLNGGE